MTDLSDYIRMLHKPQEEAMRKRIREALQNALEATP